MTTGRRHWERKRHVANKLITHTSERIIPQIDGDTHDISGDSVTLGVPLPIGYPLPPRLFSEQLESPGLCWGCASSWSSQVADTHLAAKKPIAAVAGHHWILQSQTQPSHPTPWHPFDQYAATWSTARTVVLWRSAVASFFWTCGMGKASLVPNLDIGRTFWRHS